MAIETYNCALVKMAKRRRTPRSKRGEQLELRARPLPPTWGGKRARSGRKKSGRREYVRVCLAGGTATRYPKEGAGIITSLTESDALMELPEDMTELAPGDLAPCIPLGLLHG